MGHDRMTMVGSLLVVVATSCGCVPTGRLWVVDPGNARYSVFDTAGALVATHRRPIGGYEFAWSGGFDVAGRLHERDAVPIGTESRQVLIRLDDTVEPRDTFSLPEYEERYLELRRGGVLRAMRSLPFGVRLLWRFDPIDVFDREGRYLGQARSDVAVLPYTASPVFRGQYIYAVTVDELDIPYLVRGRIVGREVAR